jgi:hypothetical protein
MRPQAALDRHRSIKASLIITSQVPVDRWDDLIGTASFATPIASIWPAKACASGGPRHELDMRAKGGPRDLWSDIGLFLTGTARHQVEIEVVKPAFAG